MVLGNLVVGWGVDYFPAYWDEWHMMGLLFTGLGLGSISIPLTQLLRLGIGCGFAYTE